MTGGLGGDPASLSPSVDEVEALRARMQQAEMTFEKEMRRLAAGRESGDATSFKTASSGTQGAPAGEPQLHAPPERPPGLPHVQGGAAGPTSPICIGEGVPVASTTEAWRNLELPSLPLPNVEGASILFGDWLTMAFPLMADISNSAKGWWEESLSVAQNHYTQWLTLTPLERIRSDLRSLWQLPFSGLSRGHRYAVGGLARWCAQGAGSCRLRTPSIYRRHIAYQPGGGAEKTQLLKNLVEAKFTAGINDLLTQVRLWREELKS